MSKCQLCLKEKDLLKRSHIIPNFMYKGMYDENHKFVSFSPKDRMKGDEKISLPSNGEYEGSILCKECDGDILSRYENYGSGVLYGGELKKNEKPIVKTILNRHGVYYDNFKNVSYDKLKLFLLSILWRASISKRPFFELISLGPHEEIIREMILTGNPKDIDDYPIFFMSTRNDNSMPKDFIAQPRGLKSKNGLRYSVFMIGGIIYMFYTNAKGHSLPSEVLRETIKPNNEMNIIHVPRGMAWEMILGYYDVL